MPQATQALLLLLLPQRLLPHTPIPVPYLPQHAPQGLNYAAVAREEIHDVAVSWRWR